jgi:hypothetical protein
MAFTTTTLSGAVAIDQNSIKVASATGFSQGLLLKVDQEFMEVAADYSSGTTINVLRGREGTATQVHATSANVIVGLSTDWQAAAPAVTVAYPIAANGFPLISYSAAGAIALPLPGNHSVAVINGTGALAMTLASPTKDMDGTLLWIVSNGKAAHTVTLTAGFGANTTNSDVMTFNASQTGCIQCIACNGVWALVGHVAGAATVAGPGLG